MFTKRKEKEETIPPFVPSSGTGSPPSARKPVEDPTAATSPGGPSTQKGPMETFGRPGPRPFRTQGSATTSTMNPHLSFQGELKYAGSVTVDCEFRGTISTDDTLVVGPSAKVDAELQAGVVEIHGKVRGNVQAKTRVKIYSGGEVCGNIETPTISMEEGVVFEGQCTRPQHVVPAAPAYGHAPASAPATGAATSVQRVLEGSGSSSKDADATA